MIDFTQDAKAIAGDFMRITNNFSFNPKSLAEELKGNKEMKKLAFYWLRTISSSDYHRYHVDSRNEIAARRGKELSEISFLKKKIEKLPDVDKMKDVTEKYILFDHHTLHQTFSGFCFYFILITSTEKQQEQLKSRFGETFYRMPLI